MLIVFIINIFSINYFLNELESASVIIDIAGSNKMLSLSIVYYGELTIQGLGNAAYPLSKLMSEKGYKIVVLSDGTGGIYNENGLNPKEVYEYKSKNKTITGYPDTRNLTNQELLELDVDILIPAAMENQITKINAHKINAKNIIEVANGPITYDADQILNVPIVPDILANAGGVLVSYFEWVQNNQGYYWSENEVLSKMKKIMEKAFDEVYEISQKKGISLRSLAYALALGRLEIAMKYRGMS